MKNKILHKVDDKVKHSKKEWNAKKNAVTIKFK